jgi:predicted metal-dependent hydrolase
VNNLKIQITKSWRKSISMRFDTHGILQVRAPKFMLKSQIEAFISKNQTWVEKEHNKIKEREENKEYYLFGNELESLPWIPTLYSKSGGLHSEASFSSDEEREFKREIEKYYKKEAKKYIVPRCNQLAEKYGFSHKWIRITSASTRWGSCSSKKTLNFSYRLIMAPKSSIDYVIVHELCHLRQMNHSSKFWSEVAAIMPDYKVYEGHLKKEWWKYRV